jgi:hypothetical protein
MNDDVLVPDLPSCRTLQIGAKYSGDIHLALCLRFHTGSLPDGGLAFQDLLAGPPPVKGVLPKLELRLDIELAA